MDHGRSWSRARLVGALGALATCFVLAPAAQAGVPPPPTTIPPGFDLFETDPGASFHDFTTTPPPGTQIPGGFFGPGSDPFQGRVQFAGPRRHRLPAAPGRSPSRRTPCRG